MKSADQMAAAWQQAMASPQTAQKYKDGINATTENPMALAAAPDAEARYLAGVTDASTSGRRAAKLNAVPVQRWKTNATTVGAQSIASGATKAKDKVQQHFQRFGPVYAQAKDAARAAKAQGAGPLARVAAAINVMRQAAGKSPIS